MKAMLPVFGWIDVPLEILSDHELPIWWQVW